MEDVPPVDLTRLVRGQRVAGETLRPLDVPPPAPLVQSGNPNGGSWFSMDIVVPLVAAFVAGFAAFYMMRPREDDPQMNEEQRKQKRNQAMMIGLVAAVVVGGGSWFVYRNYIKSSTQTPPAQLLQ